MCQEGAWSYSGEEETAWPWGHYELPQRRVGFTRGCTGWIWTSVKQILVFIAFTFVWGFEELSIRHLCLGDIVVSYVQDLRESAQGTSLSRLYNWGFDLLSFLALILLCSLCSELTRKFRIDKPGSSEFTYCLAQIRKFRIWNPKVPGLADSEFNPLYLSENL